MNSLEWELEQDKPKRGNPVASMRFQWQTCSKENPDDGYESEWASTMKDAINQAARHLIWAFNKWGKDDMIVKIYNCMNSKTAPRIVTLDDARNLIH